MKQVLKKLNYILSKKDKKFIKGLIAFSILISIIETIGISIIMPFIAVASDFTLIDTNEYYKYLYDFFNFENYSNFIIAFGAFLIFYYIFRSLIGLYYNYLSVKFSQERYHIIAYRLFENYLGMSYKNFIETNSSNLTKTIVTETQMLTGLINSFLLMVSEFFIIVFIYCMMLYVNYKITIVLTIILFLNVIFLSLTISKKIKTEGIKREMFQKSLYEVINSTLGNFKLIKLQSHDDKVLDKFGYVTDGYIKSNIRNSVFNNIPRYYLEAVGFGLLSFSITFVVWKYENNISSFLPIITMFVLGLYRILPSINRIINSYNVILYNIRALDIIHNDLMYDTESLGNDKVLFTNNITLQDMSFSYNETKFILQDISLTIKKGDKVAFIGESGSGKTTLVDIIMGLYKPCNGIISIDGHELTNSNIKSYRNIIGYIPQQVYLFDGTVAENITFGFAYDEKKIKDVLQQANILEFLEKKQEGIYTKVGEGGIKLSGGQKQRIAIARALYTDPEILVLDEATSALDNETESKIMDEIYNISETKTLIIIAHRLTTIENCNNIYKIIDGRIINKS